jgi:hypothetical protein
LQEISDAIVRTGAGEGPTIQQFDPIYRENHSEAGWHRVFERQRCGCDYLAALARLVRAFSQKLCCFDML